MDKLSKRTWAKLEAEGANTAQPPKIDLSAMSPHQRDTYVAMEQKRQHWANGDRQNADYQGWDKD